MSGSAGWTRVFHSRRSTNRALIAALLLSLRCDGLVLDADSVVEADARIFGENPGAVEIFLLSAA
jgi:hypothetical protein